jgi:hypothetical protein
MGRGGPLAAEGLRCLGWQSESGYYLRGEEGLDAEGGWGG